jgi:quercetin dioxygenase-like cupin family protein
MDHLDALKRCLRAIGARLRSGGLDALAAFERDLEELLTSKTAEASAAPAAETDLAVLRHLPEALAQAATIAPELGGALAVLSRRLQWRQNPNYVRNPPDADFLDGYGYAVITGSGGLIPARLAIGLLILAPGILYPAHFHPAEEVYLVLDHASSWWREGEEWRHGLAGTFIHHPPNLSHAMQAGSRPLCALYLWRGAVEVNAVLKSGGRS